MYFPYSGYRQPYPLPQRQPIKYFYYYPQQQPQQWPNYYQQSQLYRSYVPQQQVPPPPPMASQTLASPNRNFQSPVRQMASPQRNNPAQSQQQPQTQSFQSPQRSQGLTYNQVMERIKNANQQPQQQQPKPKPQSKQPTQQQQQVIPQINNHSQPEKQLEYTPPPQKTNYEPKIAPQQQEEQQQQQPESEQEHHEEEDEQKNDGQYEDLALQYEDGYIYRGQGYPPQTRSGFGMLTDENGKEVYVGYWQDNFYQGQGRLSNLQVEQIEGQFDWNNMTNIGNGWQSYEGMFEAGKMHGQGTLVLSNEEKFIGEFDDGMIHGDGEYYCLDGQIIKGKWDQGYLVQVNEE